MSQIIINKQWYEVGKLESTVLGRRYLHNDGQSSFGAGLNDTGLRRHPLTPIDPPPPAPPMTDREALLEIQERLRGMKAVVATREFLDKHLAETITTADAGNSG